jgi:hypothetical protein
VSLWTREQNSRTRLIQVAIKRLVTVCVAEHGSLSYMDGPMPPNAKALAAPLAGVERGTRGDTHAPYQAKLRAADLNWRQETSRR